MDAAACRDYLQRTYRYLIVDNIEEDTPAAHDLLRDWLPDCDSALLIFDQDAGYRQFLGADPQSAYRLKELCSQQVTLERSFVASPAAQVLGRSLVDALYYRPNTSLQDSGEAGATPSPLEAITYDSSRDSAGDSGSEGDRQSQRFFPQMIDWVAAQLAALVHEEGIPPRRDRRAGALPVRCAAFRTDQPSVRLWDTLPLPPPVPLPA